jgi:hypothetical protein
MFIDSDIGFEPADALRLLARPEPVIAGVYPKKGSCELASMFDPAVREVTFGPGEPRIYPLRYAGAGFLRIKTEVLQRMISELRLPLCHSDEGDGFWPFFQPTVVPQGNGHFHYLNEDWAFSHRLQRIGVTPMADTTIRLFHIGPYGFSWEESAAAPNRYQHMTFNLKYDRGSFQSGQAPRA